MKVDVEFHNPNYSVFTETFDSLADAARTMERRVLDSYYPTWEDTTAVAMPHGVDYVTHEGRFTKTLRWSWERV